LAAKPNGDFAFYEPMNFTQSWEGNKVAKNGLDKFKLANFAVRGVFMATATIVLICHLGR